MLFTTFLSVTGQSGYTLARSNVTCQTGYVHAFVSGRPSLDLLGTLKWRRDDTEELLTSPAEVADWFRSADLDVRGMPRWADVGRVRTVREALYRVVTAVRAGARPARADATMLNEIAAGPGPRLRVLPSGEVRRDVTLEQALAEVVRDAFDLLVSGAADRVRDCANPRCTRLFLDTSRAGTRRWCGMTECGNAAKVAAFRSRQREPSQRP
jgi:predicted RNA-binding Zn ribbon-like protein